MIGTLVASAAAAVAVRGTRPANVVFVCLTVLAAGVVGYAVYRALWPLVHPDAVDSPEMVGGRTRAALEREKTLVLRAIKELEFDRAMGKVSEADCEEMTARLRSRAIRVIRQLDAGGAAYRELIEKELAARLAAGRRGWMRRQSCALGGLVDGRHPSPARQMGGTGGTSRNAGRPGDVGHPEAGRGHGAGDRLRATGPRAADQPRYRPSGGVHRQRQVADRDDRLERPCRPVGRGAGCDRARARDGGRGAAGFAGLPGAAGCRCPAAARRHRQGRRPDRWRSRPWPAR